ncbi:hypothetical protein [Sodalis sp. RH16]|uniref:hypothetical protein n=1 Tax=unclassified Sodalis (in: enterobacteria) TaxID=2636512 RepID=UPI0039B5CE4E
MALSPPILPQAVNGVITTAQIEAAYGIFVLIPIDASFSVGDVISVRLNNDMRQAVYLGGSEPILVTFDDPVYWIFDFYNQSYYGQTNRYGDETFSPTVEFFLSSKTFFGIIAP